MVYLFCDSDLILLKLETNAWIDGMDDLDEVELNYIQDIDFRCPGQVLHRNFLSGFVLKPFFHREILASVSNEQKIHEAAGQVAPIKLPILGC